MNKFLFSFLGLTSFIGFITYATIETRPTEDQTSDQGISIQEESELDLEEVVVDQPLNTSFASVARNNSIPLNDEVPIVKTNISPIVVEEQYVPIEDEESSLEEDDDRGERFSEDSERENDDGEEDEDDD